MTEEKKEDATKVPDFVTYPLKTPIMAYGEKIAVIKMRRPLGADLMTVGNPVIFFPYADPLRIEHDYSRVVAMVARLSDPAIPSSSLAELDPNDLTGIAWAISPFFTPAR